MGRILENQIQTLSLVIAMRYCRDRNNRNFCLNSVGCFFFPEMCVLVCSAAMQLIITAMPAADHLLSHFIVLLLQLACCFGSAACSLCCACCPSAKNSTMTRIAFAMILLVGTVLSCLMLAPAVQDWLEGVSLSSLYRMWCTLWYRCLKCTLVCKLITLHVTFQFIV